MYFIYFIFNLYPWYAYHVVFMFCKLGHLSEQGKCSAQTFHKLNLFLKYILNNYELGIGVCKHVEAKLEHACPTMWEGFNMKEPNRVENPKFLDAMIEHLNNHEGMCPHCKALAGINLAHQRLVIRAASSK